MNAAGSFNGQGLAGGGSFEEPAARHRKRPHARLRVYPGFGPRLSPLLGESAALRADFERRSSSRSRGARWPPARRRWR
jgi:hypothetical protein